MDQLGRRLKAIRLQAGVSLRELARQADVSPSLVSQIENGKSQPSVATLYAFSQLLNVSVDELFEDESTAAPVAATRTRGTAKGTAGSNGRVDPVHAWRPTEYANRVSVVHPSHRPSLAMAEGVMWERLATPERGVNFMKITYAPGATSSDGDHLSVHDGYEYGFVVAGEVEITVGDEVFLLRQGESLGFDSSIPHVLRNPGPEQFEGIWFVHGRAH
jgi:transcriptional regulator with XRE-family HTH domain/quercetin dioxygenase-like cupin family protein